MSENPGIIQSLVGKAANVNTAIVFISAEVASFWWTKLVQNISEPTPIEVLKAKLAEAKSYREYMQIGNELDWIAKKPWWFERS
ncbi:hypothetical protein DSO57_1015018 [Entomophthora muscae]|uniref:Uncharacterized protein n=1 Tax=Entomophthora muscae TaxID=34485 RepID=A0ACC2S737_9FUNG|nr:hypothetical protein DSO57_1015018 [Entomophthora muscae]